jgi:DNA-binding NtrC family response regulator/tetratricopeptide (TPR) repeat protein
MQKLTELTEKGQYRTALKLLQSLGRTSSPAEQASRDALLAELLQRTGKQEQAVRVAERTIALGSAYPLERARCHIVLGSVLRDRGATDEALEELRRAIELARSQNSVEVEAWGSLRMLLALTEGPGLDAATAYLPTVRRAVSRAGREQLLAALHLFVAQVEAKRGLVANAREHIRIGRSLVALQPNAWLEGTAAVDSSCIAFSIADLDATRDEARKAIRQSSVAGHTNIWRAAITNLAHVELSYGRFPQALRLFQRAVRLSPPAGATQAGIADGLAQLGLARGDLDEAERILATARRWTPDSPKGTWYYGLWTTVTRTKLLMRQERFDEAAAMVASALGGAVDLADPLLTSVLRLLLVEAEARAGRTASAATILGGPFAADWPSTLELMAEYGRVAGRALAADGAAGAGRWWFERGSRALASVGHRTALANVVDAYVEAVARERGVARPSTPPVPLDRLPPPPRRVVHRLDACTPLLPPTDDLATTTLERAAAIVDAGAYPAVVGHEVIAALMETGSVPAAALVASRGGRDREVLSWFGASWTDANALAARPPRLLELGHWQGRDYAVAVMLPVGVRRLTALLALERLAGAGRFQQQARNAERERVALWPIEPDTGGDEVIACSSEMLSVVARARHVAALNVTVLITGETGTGKEMIARLIHAASPRAAKPFVPFNCTSVPRDLMDSQLFGHRRGAFTGATADHPGVVRAASGGTLCLDEIGDLGLDVQPKLLRFLENGEIQPLGDTKPQKADVRIVATTNRNLEQRVAEGGFRSDLFYRLAVVPIHIPPLRERREEVPPLAHHFLERATRDFKKERLHLAQETMEYLVLYRWPGNVRQLANEMRRLAAMAEAGAGLMPEHLDPAIRAGRRTVAAAAPDLEPTELVVRLDQPHAALIEHAERAQIRYAMQKCGGRVDDAARLLGLSRKGLYLKRQRLALE